MRVKHLALVLVAFTLFLPLISQAQQDEASVFDKVSWQSGPGSADLGDLAVVNVPEGYIFANGDDTRLLMEAMQNPITNRELGFLAPNTAEWFIVFEFEDSGYIKDDEGDSLDADDMLEALKDGNEQANKERKKRGWDTLTLIGWEQPPRYNPETHNLEWATRSESSDGQVVNWNTRLLGRTGVMEVTLVADPEILSSIQADYEALLAGFDYKSGNKYAEFTQGDKVAEYGLTALVVGGATAVAAKAGLFKYIWKIGAFVIVAVIGFFRGAIGRLFGKKD